MDTDYLIIKRMQILPINKNKTKEEKTWAQFTEPQQGKYVQIQYVVSYQPQAIINSRSTAQLPQTGNGELGNKAHRAEFHSSEHCLCSSVYPPLAILNLGHASCLNPRRSSVISSVVLFTCSKYRTRYTVNCWSPCLLSDYPWRSRTCLCIPTTCMVWSIKGTKTLCTRRMRF